jgi:hypothetical protein
LDKKISSAKVAEEFGQIPLVSEAKVGQAASDVHFLTPAAGNTILLKDREGCCYLRAKLLNQKVIAHVQINERSILATFDLPVNAIAI